MNIPILDLKPELDIFGDDIIRAITSVVNSGKFIMGPDVKAFETEVGEYLGVERAIGCNSGTDALVLSLRAMNIGPGDEVITSPFTFFATAEAISQVGATPVFVDIDEKTYNIDTSKIEEAVSEKTKAIIPVHLFGLPADMPTIMDIANKNNLLVLEDVAQAFGATINGKKVGSFGDCSAFSFFPSKTLGCYGDGGLVTTNNAALADKISMLRVHGAKKKYHNEILGYNSRLDSIQAAVLRIKLKHVDQFNKNRLETASRYNEAFERHEKVTPPQGVTARTHVYHQYTLRLNGCDRDQVAEKLKAEGVGSMIYYPIPCHKLPLYQEPGSAKCFDLAASEKASEQVISLPIWSTPLGEERQNIVIQALIDAVG